MFIKPCTAQEAGFYQTSVAEHPEFAQFMPTFIGTLALSNNQDATLAEQGAELIAQQSSAEPAAGPKKIATSVSVVLENTTHGFKHPNVLDVKLGIQLWSDDARQEKKDRFDKVTAETTHKNFGFRIAGMRVWHGVDEKHKDELDAEGFKVYSKNWGRMEVNDDNVVDSFRKFFFASTAGVDEELGKLVVEAFLAELEQVQAVMEKQESRMYSASLLFVFEGDGEALRFAMEEATKRGEARAKINGVNGHDETEDGVEDEDVEEDESPRICALKVIDFAHAEWVPGMGPDENSLVGVRSMVKILKELGGLS
jgi:1D-myo-inositol-tetrakisphosphate 5-kinase/inositol-polyphosphate multikinase